MYMNIWRRWKFLLNLVLLTLIPAERCRENCCMQDYERKFEQLYDDKKLSKLCSDAGLKTVQRRTILHHTWCRRIKWDQYSMSRAYIASKWKTGLGCKGLSSSRSLRYWYFDRISVSRWYSFTGSNRERNQQVCCRNDRNLSLENNEHRTKGELLPKSDYDWSPPWRCLPVVPIRERKWIDVNPERFRQYCFVMSKAMIRLMAIRFTISWKKSIKSSMVLCNGQLVIGYLFWQKEEKIVLISMYSDIVLGLSFCVHVRKPTIQNWR